MSGVTISDFKIRVRLDSKAATQGLRRLEKMLNTLKNSASKAVVVNAKLSKTMERMAERQAAFAEKRAKSDVRAIQFAKKMEERFRNAAKAYSDYNKSLRDSLPHLNDAKDRSGGLSNNMRKTATFSERVKGSLTAAGSAFGGIFNMHNFAILGASMWGIFSIVEKISDVVKYITRNGAKAQSAFVTLNASMANLEVSKGMSPKALNQLKKQQRNFIESLTRTYGVNMADTAVNYAKFASASANNIGLSTSQDLFKTITEYGTVFQVGPEKMERIFTSFTQMANKNQVMAEELKTQLGDSLPGALEIFIKALNRTGKYGEVTTANIWKMMEQGKIVANDVFPYIAQVMKEFSSGALPEVMGSMKTQMDIVRESFEGVFATGALNQFDDELKVIFGNLAKLANSQGFQTAVGNAIGSMLQELDKAGATFFIKLDEFEKKFDAAKTNEEKTKLADTFWSEVAGPGIESFFKHIGNRIYKWVAGMLNRFTVDDFKGFVEFIGDVMHQALARAFYLLAAAVFGEDSRMAKVLGDIIAGKNGATFAAALGGAGYDFADAVTNPETGWYYNLPFTNGVGIRDVWHTMMGGLSPITSPINQVFNFFGVTDAADSENRLGKTFSDYTQGAFPTMYPTTYGFSAP